MRGRVLHAVVAAMLLLVSAPLPAFGWSPGETGESFSTHDWIVLEAATLAGQNGYGWLDVDAAMAAASDPDLVLHNTGLHEFDMSGANEDCNAPFTVWQLWSEMIYARDVGAFHEASVDFGLISHYYSDVCNPLHTGQSADEALMHDAYESAVAAMTDTPHENAEWVTSDGVRVIGDPYPATEAAARTANADYSALVSGYGSGGIDAVAPITRRSLSLAVNGLADMIETMESAPPAGNGGDATQKFTRLAGNTRFDVGVTLARQGFPRWLGADDVVIASGDDRAAADPLAAASLCWAYDAPLLLVSATTVPPSVLKALAEIKYQNPDVTVHVVGGPGSVPDARLAQIRAIVGQSAVERLPYGDRYTTAANIARRVRTVAAEQGRSLPSAVLVANGADPGKFFDALSLSAISSRVGAPILLVRADGVPTPTSAALAELAPASVYVAGGTGTVSESVVTRLRAERWAGRTRYETAVRVANKAIGKGWLAWEQIGVAAKLPDALTGGAFIGRAGGPLLVSASAWVPQETAQSVRTASESLRQGYVFGGTGSISEATRVGLNHLGDPDYVVP